MNAVKPAYLLAGGGFSDSRGMAADIAGALGECGSRPRVAYLGAASGDNAPFYGMIRPLIARAGAAEVFMVRLAHEKADVPAARRALESADALFISGGEVEDGMRWLARHGLVGFIRELRERGKTFIGVSAGSIMMGSHWVRWAVPGDDTTAELFECLGFASVVFDTHAEEEDWIELRTALRLKGPGALGYGIPRGSMAVVDGLGRTEASGKALLPFVNREGRVLAIK